MTRSNDLRAVWVGRFQPTHLGHLQILTESLRVVHLPHVVVLPYDFRAVALPHDNEYLVAAQNAYRPDANPLTVWERLRLMSLALSSLPDGDRVFPVAAPHHESRPGIVDEFFPANRLICVTDKDAFEGAKASYWRRRAEEVRVIPIGRDVLTTTMVRRLIVEGADWRSFMPETAHSYFDAIDGPRRLFSR
jgi:nicotinic acid mononucleotide adenylyltransferase